MPRMTIADAIADKVRELEEENVEIRKALDERTLSTNKRLRERVSKLAARVTEQEQEVDGFRTRGDRAELERNEALDRVRELQRELGSLHAGTPLLNRDKLIRELKERIRSLECTEKWVLGANRELERENKLVRSRNRALDDRVKELKDQCWGENRRLLARIVKLKKRFQTTDLAELREDFEEEKARMVASLETKIAILRKNSCELRLRIRYLEITNKNQRAYIEELVARRSRSTKEHPRELDEGIGDGT